MSDYLFKSCGRERSNGKQMESMKRGIIVDFDNLLYNIRLWQARNLNGII